MDFYARWRNQTDEEREKQITGFGILKGHVGYLREAYHGQPYATSHFVSEAFNDQDGQAQMEAKTLRDRLSEAPKLVRTRERKATARRTNTKSGKGKKALLTFTGLAERYERRSTRVS